MRHDSSVFRRRTSLLQHKFNNLCVDNLLILDMNNVYYLTGFTGSDGLLLISKDKAVLLVDGRYTTQAAEETSDVHIVEYKDKIEGISQAINDCKLNNIGFESQSISVQLFDKLSKKLIRKKFVPLVDELKLLRAFKEDAEILLMKKAAAISSAAIESLISLIKPGWTEKEIALQLEIIARKAGADQLAFEAIIASGKNSALPHARPSERKIKKGDLIVVDFGVKYQGYCSDETCTFALGGLSAERRNIYQIVKYAHDQAIDAVCANVQACKVDQCARGIFGKKYDSYYTHGTGHGVGLDVHEAPRLAPSSPDILGANMIVTIEPGLYFPGRFGIRIEDMVLVKENSCEILSKMNKELLIIE